jgi:hypothetical protein
VASEYQQNLRQELIKEIRLAQHAYEKRHNISWSATEVQHTDLEEIQRLCPFVADSFVWNFLCVSHSLVKRSVSYCDMSACVLYFTVIGGCNVMDIFTNIYKSFVSNYVSCRGFKAFLYW